MEESSPQSGRPAPPSGSSWSELLYAQLRSQAAFHLKAERDGHTLQPTALINEAYVRLCACEPLEITSRTRFLALASRTFRRVLVDHARRRKALKRTHRAGVRLHFPGEAAASPAGIDVLYLNEILLKLDQVDERAGRIVELKFFGGLTNEQIAHLLDLSLSTIESDWRFARAWLSERLAP